MNRIILIGNGFDLAHGYPTRYEDFINWYWDKRVHSFHGNLTPLSEDCLCSIKMASDNSGSCWNIFAFNITGMFDKGSGKIIKPSGKDVIKAIENDTEQYEFKLSPFFRSICESIEIKGWVDIEREYYNHVKMSIDCNNASNATSLSIRELNYQLEYLRQLLVEYLKSFQYYNRENEEISNIIYGHFNSDDISVARQSDYFAHCENHGTLIPNGKEAEIKFGNKKFSEPCNVLLLNFNYTPIAIAYLLVQIEELRYGKDLKADMIFIHGDITKPRTLIFGYGDELDDTYDSLLKFEDNEYLKFIKSIKYLESDNYRKLLEFIESDSFQIYIMGHSCGNSDRTLLNTLFEHRNCVSIKPYYYQKEDGSDNYMEIVQNICRNFTDMKLMRDRVVNKTFCEPLPQSKTNERI